MRVFSRHGEGPPHGAAHWLRGWRGRLRARRSGVHIELHTAPDAEMVDELLMSLYEQGHWSDLDEEAQWWLPEEGEGTAIEKQPAARDR